MDWVTATASTEGTGTEGCYGGIIAGVIILGLALAVSFLIPKPAEGATGDQPDVPAAAWLTLIP